MNLPSPIDQKKNTLDEFLTYIKPLFNFAHKLTGDDEDAEDLVQDTYLRAVEYLHTYRPGTNARSWLFRIMHSIFINDYRRKMRNPLLDNRLKTDYSHYNKSINPSAFANSVSDEVMFAFNGLDPEFKSALFLREFEGLRYDEISKILDIQVNTVKTRIFRARAAMRKKLMASGYFSRNN